MPLHLYCIVPAGHDVPDRCAGVESRRPFALDAGVGLAVWATEHEDPVTASVDAVRSHNAVVSAAMDRRVTPVPLRFGQSAPDRDAAVEHVVGDAAKWLSLLERFAGRAEYGVRALRDVYEAEQDVHPAAVQTGTEYMAALAGKQARAMHRQREGERVAGEVSTRAGHLVDDVRVEYPAGGATVATIAHLVAWATADAYHDALNELREQLPDTRLVVTGPWPPYSFIA